MRGTCARLQVRAREAADADPGPGALVPRQAATAGNPLVVGGTAANPAIDLPPASASGVPLSDLGPYSGTASLGTVTMAPQVILPAWNLAANACISMAAPIPAGARREVWAGLHQGAAPEPALCARL